ncbi:MAG TPA: hypothetical protein VN881_03425 [Candidatus Acidoferrales bacterium]|nr:hypothetical protein [Candidatus Acidoferrales bacterium]
MNRWSMVVVLVLLVLASAVGLNALSTHATLANTGAPMPPTPWLYANTGAPMPPTPWMNTGAPMPPTPW